MSYFSSKSNKQTGSLLPFSPSPVFRASPDEVQPNFPRVVPHLSPFGLPGSKPDWQSSISSPNQSFNRNSKDSGIYCKSVLNDKLNTMNTHNTPVWTESINWKNSFKTFYEPSKMLQQIKNYCQRKHILDIYVNNQQFEILGRYFSFEHELAEFMIRVFKLVGRDHSNGSTLVQITRRHGSQNAFQSFYIDFVNDMRQNGLTTFPSTNHNLNSLQMPSFDLDDLNFDSLETPSKNKLDFLVETVEMIENGFRQEAQTAASTLAKQSTQPEVIQILDNIPDLTERLLSICSQSVDVLMVRCILVILLNGLLKTYGGNNLEIKLCQIRDRWSTTQKLFNCQIEIFQSREITSKVDQLLNATA